MENKMIDKMKQDRKKKLFFFDQSRFVIKKPLTLNIAEFLEWSYFSLILKHAEDPFKSLFVMLQSRQYMSHVQYINIVKFVSVKLNEWN